MLGEGAIGKKGLGKKDGVATCPPPLQLILPAMHGGFWAMMTNVVLFRRTMCVYV